MSNAWLRCLSAYLSCHYLVQTRLIFVGQQTTHDSQQHSCCCGAFITHYYLLVSSMHVHNGRNEHLLQNNIWHKAKIWVYKRTPFFSLRKIIPLFLLCNLGLIQAWITDFCHTGQHRMLWHLATPRVLKYFANAVLKLCRNYYFWGSFDIHICNSAVFHAFHC